MELTLESAAINDNDNKKSAMVTWHAADVAEPLCLYELAEPPKCHAYEKTRNKKAVT